MRVLHINSYSAGSRFYKTLYNYQKAEGIDLRNYVPVHINDDVPTDHLGEESDIAPIFTKLERYFFHLKYGKVLKDAKNRYGAEKFDLIHAHSLFSNGYVAMMLAKKMGVPYIVAIRDTDTNIFFKYMVHLRHLGKTVLKNAAKVIFISPEYRENALKPYLSEKEFAEVYAKSIVIPNGVDDFWQNNKAKSKHYAPSAPVRLLLVGHFVARKNIPTALQATHILRERGYDATLTVIGKPIEQSIVDMVEQDPIATRLQLRPMQELQKVYGDADIFVLPSTRETFGLVYVEAMTQGLPVLYTKGQGFDGQIPQGSAGYAVLPTNASDIADKAEMVLKNYDAMSQKAVELCGQFNWQKIAREYCALYRKIVK